MERRKILPLPGLELRTLGRSAAANRYTDCAILFQNKEANKEQMKGMRRRERNKNRNQENVERERVRNDVRVDTNKRSKR
jgi:hypothetical protein